jgi:exonuclease SbcC
VFFYNEIASKSAIITNELSKLKSSFVFSIWIHRIVEIRDEKQNYISKTIDSIEHKSKSDAMVLLNQELAGLEASLKW